MKQKHSSQILKHFVNESLIASLAVMITQWWLLSPLDAYAMERVARSSTPPPAVRPLGSPLAVTPERFALDQKEKKHVLSAEEIATLQVFIKDGALHNVKSEETLKTGHYMYFLNMSDELFLIPLGAAEHRGDDGRVFHSSFDPQLDPHSRKGICKMAGEMLLVHTESRHVCRINHDSGHYKPPFEKTALVQQVLLEHGFKGEIILTKETW
jgi:hypothetical protein